MKFLKLAVAAAAVLAFGSAYAFHSGGVAECGGCHSMHSANSGDMTLLKNSDASSTCLSCHASNDTAPTRYHIMTYPAPGAGLPPVEMTPGGDFAWLLKTYTNQPRTSEPAEIIWGEMHGHNVVAADFGILADDINTVAPGGGTLTAANLGCNSCHDPHGRLRRYGAGGDSVNTYVTTGAPIIGSGSYTNSKVPTATQAVGMYRILRGSVAVDGSAAFTVNFAGNFLAIAPATYNRSEATTPTRVAYGSDGSLGADTVGRWCASCHPNMHSSGGRFVHPIDTNLNSTYVTNYNTYVSSGIMNGAAASSFLELTPFAEVTGDFGVLKTRANFGGQFLGGPGQFPTGGTALQAQVMCLSCHRAHASGFPEALRWNYDAGEFITATDTTGAVAWPGSDGLGAGQATGMTTAETNAAYYGIPASRFGAYQRQLCNKCHAKD